MKLFDPVVEVDKLHPNFSNTLEDHCLGVRKVLQGWAEGFVDRDGKFLKEFQTTYNSSFWELYLFAVLKHLNMRVDFSNKSPDFFCPDQSFSIEAAIASNAYDDVPEWEKTFGDITDENIWEIYEKTAIRLSNSINSKISKYNSNYSELPHVKDKPFIIAIANYGRPDFMFHGDVSMQWLLYDGLKKKKICKSNGAEIPLGLFRSDEFSDISAVIYSSLATFGKARALSDDEGDFIFHAVRIKDNFTPIRISAKKNNYNESLCDGLRLFINPFAKNPIKLEDFNDQEIRIFNADKNGDYEVSCHEDGDLCMRLVGQHIHTKS